MRDEIIEVEKRFWQAIQDGDAETASSLMTEPGIVTGAQGASTITREQFRKMMAAPAWKILKYEFSDIQVEFPQKDLAVIAYKVHEDLMLDGKPLSMDCADASVWVRRESGWQCALHTESLLGDPFGRDKAKAPAADPSGLRPNETFDRAH